MRKGESETMESVWASITFKQTNQVCPPWDGVAQPPRTAVFNRLFSQCQSRVKGKHRRPPRDAFSEEI